MDYILQVHILGLFLPKHKGACIFQKLNTYCFYGAFFTGLMYAVSLSAAPSKSNSGQPTNAIAGIYQGIIPLFDEPITLRLEQDGNAQYITTPELHRETTALGSWKLLSRRRQVDTLELVTIAYIRDGFCDELIVENRPCK